MRLRAGWPVAGLSGHERRELAEALPERLPERPGGGFGGISTCGDRTRLMPGGRGNGPGGRECGAGPQEARCGRGRCQPGAMRQVRLGARRRGGVRGRKGPWAILALWALAGCADFGGGGGEAGGRVGIRIDSAGDAFRIVGDSVEPAADIAAMIAPYRSRMAEGLGEVLGHATAPFFKADPEGELDNLVADALLAEARLLSRDTVHLALINEGGLRVPIAAGPILMRHAYELLPFENYVTVLELTGAEVERLADEIAATDGEPIAGWSMELVGRDAVNVRVGGEEIDPARSYRLATVDYLVNGGGSWTVLWEAGARGREDLDALIRDIFVSYLGRHEMVTPVLDGRIRRLDGGGERC